MATQSITNVALLASSVGNNRSSNSTEKVAAQRQTVAVEVTAVETQEVDVELSQKALEKVVSQLNAYIQNTQRDMDFSVDGSTGRVVVKVIDSESEQVIRQIPSEEMLAISRHLIESLETEEPKGFLIELKA
ncbi:MAG: flagellar protein FlaG [Gammaproteobacteria bacterium]|nr:flagellar protein FlaG [Gammaproteobacteria bacterium]MDH5660469.1 flagellar protein FlaG [Gammaproteobacteria bacterium]